MLAQKAHTAPLPNLIDSSADLVSYASFIDLLHQRFSDHYSKKALTALLFIGFDNLTHLNEILGFNAETQLMTKIAKKLNSILKSEYILTKVNNYQYIIMQDLYDLENPKALAKDIIHLFSEPCVIDAQMFYINASIGISHYPYDGKDAYSLIKMAEDAMKDTQKNEKNGIEFAKNISISPFSEKSARIMKDFPAAIENGEIYFLYQSQYSYAKKNFVGAEMLARWKHPEYGEISPEFFIPLAEQSGMIDPLSVRSLIIASKAFALLENKGMSNFSLSLNISPAFLMSSSFDATIHFLLEQYDLRGKNLNFEITEEVLIKNTDNLLKSLNKLKKLNIGIEIDDFGTGYTSLQHLAYLPIDTLKVDRSFVSNIDKDTRKRALFKAIVEMSHALDIDVIAEGVENSLEDTVIQTFDSIISQGYFYSKPMHLNTLIETVVSP